MLLNTQTVNAYRDILSDPKKQGLHFKPMADYFQESDIVTAKHTLFEKLIEVIKVPLPKVIFYILIDEAHNSRIGKDAEGNLGYALSFVNEEIPAQVQ